MTNTITRYNDPMYYDNTFADMGINREVLPENAIFATRDGEEVYATVMPYNPTPEEKIFSMLDDVDIAIVEEVGRSKYLTSLQIYQYVVLRGFQAKRTGIRNRLNKLMKCRMLREFEMKSSDVVHGIRFYELDFRGFQLALKNDVTFHMGNRFLSNRKKVELGFVESTESIKRILTGNMIVLGLLMNNVDINEFHIMETERPIQETPITDGSIIRTAASVKIDEDVILYEVVRSSPHSMRKLADKISRYYNLLQNESYLKNNVHGYSSLPQFVICAESLEHARKIDAYLRERGLWRKQDTILYTHDLLYLKRTLRTLYELREDGTQCWYSMPSRYSVEAVIA